MKVLLVNKFHYMKGGSERYYFTLAEAFKEAGHEVIFFAMQDEKNVPCEQSKYFVSNASVSGGFKSKINMIMHISYSKEAYKKMRELCDIEKPDLVILNLVHKQITCSVIDAIKDSNPNTKIVWTMHDLICVCPAYTMLDGQGKICEKCLDGNFNHCKENKCIHGSKLMSWLSTYEAKQIKKHKWYDKIDLYVCPSKFYKDKLDGAHFTKSKIVWIPNPLPTSFPYELNTNDDKYILYFGRLSKEKGIISLIDAMKSVDYKLKIAGTGPLKEEIEGYIKTNELKNIELLGFKSGEELNNLIRKSRCVVLPSEWYENGPYSAMEALALGKPLIVSNLGGLPELVNNGENGLIFGNKEQLVDSLKKMILMNSNDYEIMCNKSLELAKNNFNAKKYVEEIIK